MSGSRAVRLDSGLFFSLYGYFFFFYIRNFGGAVSGHFYEVAWDRFDRRPVCR